MRWTWVLVVILVLGFGAAWYVDFQRKEAAIAEDSVKCEVYNRELGVLLYALKGNDVSLCASLGDYFKARCTAFIMSDPEKCSVGDSDCQVIASKTIDACFDPVCRAFILRSPDACAGLDGPPLKTCTDVATLNAKGVVKTAEQCEAELRSII